MDYGKYVNIKLEGKKILKDGKENGIIVAFDGRAVIDVKFENEPELVKQYALRALWKYSLTTDDEELNALINKLVCIETMELLNISQKFIDGFFKNDTVYLFDGRTAKAITSKNEPEIFLKIKGFEKRKGTKIFGVFNEPTGYGEKSETYVFLDSDLSKNYPPQKKGNIVSAVVNEWDVETGRTGVPKIRFQLSNGGVWCMPIHYW